MLPAGEGGVDGWLARVLLNVARKEMGISRRLRVEACGVHANSGLPRAEASARAASVKPQFVATGFAGNCCCEDARRSLGAEARIFER